MNHTPRFAFAVLLAAASAPAQGPTVTHPHFGTYAAGSPEVSPTGLRPSDVVERVSGMPPSMRLAASALKFPTNTPLDQLEITALAVGNDVFAPWGPTSTPPTGTAVRHTEIQYTVDAGTTIVDPNSSGGTTPVAPCGGSPLASQIFSVQLTYDSSTSQWNASTPTPVSCGVGSTSGSSSTVLGGIAWDPGATHEFPIFFAVSPASATMLRGVAGYSGAESCNIYCADGVQPPFVVFDGLSLFKRDDVLDAFAMSAYGYVVVSLGRGSPSLNQPLPAFNGADAITADENTLIGYIPPTATTWTSIPPAPPGAAIGSPFVWAPPWLLGLGAPNGSNPNSNGINDNLNGLQIGDPFGQVGYSGNLPLRGTQGDLARERLHLTVGDAGGNGGGVFHIRLGEWAPLTVEFQLSNVIMNGNPAEPLSAPDWIQGGVFEWALLLNVGMVDESHCTVFNNAPFAPGTCFMFDPSPDVFGTSLFPAVGTILGLPYLWTQNGAPLQPGQADWAETIASGLPSGVYTLQAIVAHRHDSTRPLTYYSTNCVQLDVAGYTNPF